MGRVFFPADFMSDHLGYRAGWFMPTHWRNSHYTFDLPNAAFPVRALIHMDVFEHDKFKLIEIRRWLERNQKSDAYIEYTDMEYHYSYTKKSVVRAYLDDNAWRVKHGYWHIWLESEEELMFFKLRWGDIMSPEIRR